MKIKTLIIVSFLTLYGCVKENDILSPSNIALQDNALSLRQGDEVRPTRKFSQVGSGPGTFEPMCYVAEGNCLDDLIITPSASFKLFENAVKSSSQIDFFNSFNYSTLFGVYEDNNLQEGLEKGHLKFKKISTEKIDYWMIVKPQHEKFGVTKLVGKTKLVIPVLK